MSALETLLQCEGCSVSTNKDAEIGTGYCVANPMALKLHLERRCRVDTTLVDQLVGQIEALMQDNAGRLTLTQHMRTEREDTSSLFHAHESLLRLLLGVELLQTPLLCLLLERFPELECEEREETATTLLLQHMKWLDVVYQPATVMDSFTQVIDVCSTKTRNLMIVALPDIMHDQIHEGLVVCLERLLQEDTSMAPVVLHALYSLRIPEDLQDRIQCFVLDLLNTVGTQDLPVLIKFVAKHADKLSAASVLKRLLTTLEAVHSVDTTSKQTGDESALSLDAFLQSCKSNAFVVDAFFKRIRSTALIPHLHVAELWFLIECFSIPRYASRVVSTLKTGLGCGQVTVLSLHDAFATHLNMIVSSRFNTIVGLAEKLILASEDSMAFAVALFNHLLRCIDDALRRQHIVKTLLTHIGADLAESNDVLSILVSFFVDFPNERGPLLPFCSTLMDAIEFYPLETARLVYTLMSLMGDAEASRGSINLAILVRKQLSRPEPVYQKLGAIGTVALSKRDSAQQNQALELAFDRLNASPTFSTFLDELSVAIEHNSFETNTLEWVKERIQSCFESSFMAELPHGPSVTMSQSNQTRFNLDGDLAEIRIPLLDCASDRITSANLSSMFRLLCSIERRCSAGSLKAVDALLGCPLQLRPAEDLVHVERLNSDELCHTALALFHAIDWIHGLFNQFGDQTNDEEVRSKLAQRALHRTSIKAELASIVNFLPKRDNFDLSKAQPLSWSAYKTLDCLLHSLPLGALQTDDGPYIKSYEDLLGQCSTALAAKSKERTLSFRDVVKDTAFARHLGIMYSRLLLWCSNDTSSLRVVEATLRHLLQIVALILRAQSVPSPARKSFFSAMLDQRPASDDDQTAAFHLFHRCSTLECLQLETASRLLDVLVHVCPSEGDEERRMVEDLAHKFLSTAWTGRLTPASISSFVECMIQYAADPLQTMRRLAEDVIPGYCQDEEADFKQTLDKTTVHVFFAKAFQCLVAHLDKLENTHADGTTYLTNVLAITELASALFQVPSLLPTNTKVLGDALLYGQQFLARMIQSLSILDALFSTYAEATIHLLKTTQHGTRTLQILCAHAKRTRVASVVSRIPAARKTLEEYIYSVKSMFHAKGLQHAFYQGTLKAKRIDGTEDMDSEPESDASEASETTTSHEK